LSLKSSTCNSSKYLSLDNTFHLFHQLLHAYQAAESSLTLLTPQEYYLLICLNSCRETCVHWDSMFHHSTCMKYQGSLIIHVHLVGFFDHHHFTYVSLSSGIISPSIFHHKTHHQTLPVSISLKFNCLSPCEFYLWITFYYPCEGQVKCGYVVFTVLGAAFHISSTDGM
jgi:hypothetical protein